MTGTDERGGETAFPGCGRIQAPDSKSPELALAYVSISSKIQEVFQDSFGVSRRVVVPLSPSTMEGRLVRRPIIDLLSGRSQCLLSLNTTARRHESSYRRTKQRLNVKPDASFVFSNHSPQQDHIIFNPPSSAPCVLHTPLKFLPKEDKRRQLFAATAARKGSSSSTQLPPPVRPKQKYPHHHLSDTDIAEIQRLHASDPETWTNARLSRKFNCSMMFVMICIKNSGGTPSQNGERRRAQTEAVKAKWGPRRRMAREDRLKRKELALRDE